MRKNEDMEMLRQKGEVCGVYGNETPLSSGQWREIKRREEWRRCYISSIGHQDTA